MTRKKFPKTKPWRRRKLSINSALNRQTQALESHEAKIAAHTALQSYIAIVTTIVSFVTTLALGYISYLQYKTSSRQVELDYAKIAPQWEFTTETRYPRGGNDITFSGPWDHYPIAANVSLQRGEAKVNKIQIFQDMQVSRATKLNKKFGVDICIARFENYFVWNGNGLKLSTNPKALQIADVPSWDVPAKGDRIDTIRFSPKDTWAKVQFTDIFGKNREIVLQIHDKYTSIAPNGVPPKDDLWPIVEAKLNTQRSWRTNALLERYVNPTKAPECERIFSRMIIR